MRKFIKTKIVDFLNEKKHNSKLIEVKPHKFIYHTSNPIFREKIPKEVEEYYNKNLKFKAKKIFVLEKNTLIPTDETLLQDARNQLKQRFNFNQASPQ